jgi:hypothetical protein
VLVITVAIVMLLRDFGPYMCDYVFTTSDLSVILNGQLTSQRRNMYCFTINSESERTRMTNYR